MSNIASSQRNVQVERCVLHAIAETSKGTQNRPPCYETPCYELSNTSVLIRAPYYGTPCYKKPCYERNSAAQIRKSDRSGTIQPKEQHPIAKISRSEQYFAMADTASTIYRSTITGQARSRTNYVIRIPCTNQKLLFLHQP